MSTAAPAEPPKSASERALAAVPVVLTVLATIEVCTAFIKWG